MRAAGALQRYLESATYEQRMRRSLAHPEGGDHPRSITISRLAGSGAHVVAHELVARLRSRAASGSTPWTIFDRNLVDQVLKDHELPDRLTRFMPEDRVSGIADTMDELFGLHPPTRVLVRKTAETILQLVELGNVVVIGRGGAIITGNLDHVFHVRLVGSTERRVAYLREHKGLDARAAATFLRENDLARKRYVKTYYGKDIDDPLLYHLVINTDLVPYAEAARLIADAVAAVPDTGAGRLRGSRVG